MLVLHVLGMARSGCECSSCKVLLLKYTLSLYVKEQIILISPGSSEEAEVFTLVIGSGLCKAHSLSIANNMKG